MKAFRERREREEEGGKEGERERERKREGEKEGGIGEEIRRNIELHRKRDRERE